MSRPIPAEALDIAAKWEGFRATAYFCPADVATIGYGHTKTVRPADVGHKTITEAEARELLASDMLVAAEALTRAITHEHVERLSNKQYAALLSFVFNVGAGLDWTIWKKVKSQDDAAVPEQLMRFVNAGGRRLEGLVRRRTDEATLWRAGMLPTAVVEEGPAHAPPNTPPPRDDYDFQQPRPTPTRPPRPAPSTPIGGGPRPSIVAAFTALLSAILAAFSKRR